VLGKNDFEAIGIDLSPSANDSVPVAFPLDIQIAKQQVKLLNLYLLKSFFDRELDDTIWNLKGTTDSEFRRTLLRKMHHLLKETDRLLKRTTPKE
jgi:hypothetical protein